MEWCCIKVYLYWGAFIAFLILYKKVIGKRFFPWFLQHLSHSKIVGGPMKKIKKELFDPLNQTVSHNPGLRQKKVIRILEIGVGTGVNFEFYPEGTHLTVIDPNPHFKSYYDANRKKFPTISSEEIIVAKGEDMDMVETGSIDAVIMTLVLCSVEDIGKLVQQIYRVLAPGGKFYFLEHVKDQNTSNVFRRFFQEALTFTGVWPFLFDGCDLNRDPLPAIKKVPFQIVEEQYTDVAMPKIFYLVGPTCVGTATK